MPENRRVLNEIVDWSGFDGILLKAKVKDLTDRKVNGNAGRKPFSLRLMLKVFVIEFVDWYNNEHLHSGLDLLTPCAVHFGYHQEILDRRNALLERSRELHPERFGGRRKFYKIEETVCLKHRIHLPKAG